MNESMMFGNDIITLRFLIGYLGERVQANWWPSDFLASNNEAFLLPIFGKTAGVAQFSGVTEAARRVHDERIGVGRVFHLFRLPETIEQRCFEFLQRSPSVDEITELLTSRETALAALREIAAITSPIKEGPIKVGNTIDFKKSGWLSKTAGVYCGAFEKGIISFPYFTAEE